MALYKVTSLALKQWRQLCPNSVLKTPTDKELKQKIKRACFLGQRSYVYKNGCYVVRYYYLNLLLSEQNEIMTVWQDKTTPPVYVKDELKKEYNNSAYGNR